MHNHIDRLPVYSHRDEILAALRQNQVLIVTGETGSGKSTLLPLFCREAGYCAQGKIAVTEPRRIAAITLASYTAHLDNSPLGSVIGYTIRYHHMVRAHSQIVYMTDGVLATALMRDPLLNRYSVCIIDEAHERSMNVDFLLGYLRILLKKRPELKLIIASAAIDARFFSRAFFHAPVINVEGRRYPIDLRYQPVMALWKGTSIDSYIEGVGNAIQEICLSGEKGDVLVFLPTVDDITETINRVRSRICEPDSILLPLHGRLTFDRQQQVFKRHHGRKIVVATNIAETSLTVPGIRFVIDSGLVRMLRYEPSASVSTMPIEKISRASADQRAGRCGRVRDGVCIRLYSEQDYLSRPAFTLPEIQRINCTGFILRMHLLPGVHPASFPFLQRPSPAALNEGYRQLRELGALDARRRITKRGTAMARLPLDPPVACMVLAAQQHGALKEILIIAAALSATDPLAVEEGTPPASINRFRHQESDFMTYLAVWHELRREVPYRRRYQYTALRSFAVKYGLHPLRLREWIDAHDHLEHICKDLQVFSGGHESGATYETIHKCLLAGLIGGIAVRKSSGCYEGVSASDIHVASVSVNAGKNKRWLLFHELTETGRIYGTHTAAIDPKWIEALFKDTCTYRLEDPWYDTDQGVVYVHETVSYRSLTIIRNRRKECHEANRMVASEVFIREALARGLIGGSYRFMEHNETVKKRIVTAEVKLRRTLYAGDDALETFYEDRVDGMATRAELEAFIRVPGNEKKLYVTLESLLATPLPDDIDEYNEVITVASVRVPVQWQYAPGSDDDGATVVIPEKLADMLPVYYWEWQLPILRKQRTDLLIARITKKLLARDIDPADVFDAVLMENNLPVGPWIETTIQCIERLYQVEIDYDELVRDGFPHHLWPGVRVVNERGIGIDTFRPPLTFRRLKKPRALRITTGRMDLPVTLDYTVPGCFDRDMLLKTLSAVSPGQQVPCAVWQGLLVDQGRVITALFTAEAVAQTAHAYALRHLLEAKFAEQLAWEIETLAVPATILRRAVALSMTVDISIAAALMLKSILALPERLPVQSDDFTILTTAVAQRIDGSASKAVQVIEECITAFETIGRQWIRRKERHSSSVFELLHATFADEIEYYKNALTDPEVSFEYIRCIPHFINIFSRFMDAAYLDPVRFHRTRGVIAACRDAIATIVKDTSIRGISDYPTLRIRERLRLAIEQYRADLLAPAGKKQDAVIDLDTLERMKKSLLQCYHAAVLL